MCYGLALRSIKVVGQKADEVQVSVEEWMQVKAKN